MSRMSDKTRIKTLRQRLAALRKEHEDTPVDSTHPAEELKRSVSAIGIEAIEAEITKLSKGLATEWNLLEGGGDEQISYTGEAD